MLLFDINFCLMLKRRSEEELRFVLMKHTAPAPKQRETFNKDEQPKVRAKFMLGWFAKKE